MLFLIFGDDEFACHEALEKLRAASPGGDAARSLADLNRSVLDGKRLSLSELRHHCDAVPFLAERRMVVVEGLVTRLDGRRRSSSEGGEAEDAIAAEGEAPTPTPKTAAAAAGGADAGKALLDELLTYLPGLPETTDLVLLDVGLTAKTSRGRLARWAADHGARVQEHPQKRPEELGPWIKERVRAAGGKIDPRAVQQLIDTVGSDLRALSQEIEKLTLYVEPGRSIGVEDVRQLVPHSKEANIFPILDAISQGQGAHALAGLRQLLDEGAHPLYVLTMIQSQFSAIVQARALRNERLAPAELARRLDVKEYPAKKAQQLASRYTDRQLLEIYERLLQTDLAIKTGQREPTLALELLVASLGSKP